MESIEKLIWKKLDGELTPEELTAYQGYEEHEGFKELFSATTALHLQLKQNSTLTAPTSLVHLVMQKVEKISIVPSINYNRILIMAIIGIIVVSIPALYFNQSSPELSDGMFQSVIQSINLDSLDFSQLNILPYFFIIPCITFLIWIDQSFSFRHKA